MAHKTLSIVTLSVIASLSALTGCGAAPAEAPASDQLVDLSPAQLENAADEARAMAEIVKVQASNSSQRVINALPIPAWSRYPHLRGVRVRWPLEFDKPREPGPVMMIMLDTTRADHLSAYGYHRDTTPNLRKLSDESVRFTRFYSNGAWTRPSVASIMTSRYRSQHNAEVIPGNLSEEHVTLAEMFKEAGYATAAFNGNQTVRTKYGFAQGFDHYEDIYEELDRDPPASQLVRRARRWLEKNDNPRWFTWLFLVDPHDPYNPPRKYDRWPEPSRKRVGTPRVEYAEPMDERRVKRMRSLYDAEILEMDEAIGELIDWLKKDGRWDNLTLLIVGDHGEAFGEHNCFKHAYHFWEPNINVPLIIRSPHLREAGGLIEDRLFHGVDIAPTLLELSGTPTPVDWTPMGRSIAQTLTGPIIDGWRRSVFTELDGYGLKRAMIRRGNFKYMRFEPTNMHTFKHVWPDSHSKMATAINTTPMDYLYNVARDPGETDNLAAKLPRVVGYMRREMEAFKTAVEDLGESGPLDLVEGLSPEEIEDLRALGYIE